MAASTTWRRATSALATLLALGGPAACAAPAGDTAPVIVPGRPGDQASTIPPGQATAAKAGLPDEADVAYLRNMIMHHQQAIDMTALVPQRAASDAVRRLADRIAGTQGPEIGMMNTWLRTHGQPAVEPGAHAGHDPTSMPGMATPAQLDALRAATGAEFDRQFLRLMIAHHEGALTMAHTAQNSAVDVRVQEMADDVIATQTAEINRMRSIGLR